MLHVAIAVMVVLIIAQALLYRLSKSILTVMYNIYLAVIVVLIQCAITAIYSLAHIYFTNHLTLFTALFITSLAVAGTTLHSIIKQAVEYLKLSTCRKCRENEREET